MTFLFQEHLSNVRHCVLQSDLGYTQFNLELHGVHDVEDDKYINVTVYLIYNFDNARPYKIEVDTRDANKLSNEVRRRLKTSLRVFKISDLKTAFDTIVTDENSGFTWIQIEDTDDSEEPSVQIFSINLTTNKSRIRLDNLKIL